MGSIKPSGYGGRILKGDVLAHLGLIAPKPAPQPNFTAAPPRDQIVFAKVVHDDIKGEFFFNFLYYSHSRRRRRKGRRRKTRFLSL